MTKDPRFRYLVGAGLILACAVTLSILGGRDGEELTTLRDGPVVTAPRGVRVKVQVLNGTDVPGLAARATRYLRERGFDVVESGNSVRKVDSTAVYDRSGHPEWAMLVARALAVGAAPVTEIDSSRFVDVTVVVGRDWRTSADSLRP